jgi:hypothetical protein
MRRRFLAATTLLLAALALAACGQLHAPRVIDYGTSYDQGGGT